MDILTIKRTNQLVIGDMVDLEHDSVLGCDGSDPGDPYLATAFQYMEVVEIVQEGDCLLVDFGDLAAGYAPDHKFSVFTPGVASEQS